MNRHTWIEVLRYCYSDVRSLRCCPMAVKAGTTVTAGPFFCSAAIQRQFFRLDTAGQV